MKATEYLEREFSNAQVLYKNLSAVKALGPAQKKATLKMVEAQLDLIEQLDGDLGTPLEERKVAFVNRVLIEARRLCLK